MTRPLRILHLEDDPDYCDLVRSLLESEGFQVEAALAGTRAEFEAALAPGKFDIILADYLLPTYNGLEALCLAREKCPDTPFLLVSGNLGEQSAIESLRTGVTDYVLKQWPERLIPAITRAVHEAEERRQRRRVETELTRREKYFRALTENSLDILTILNPAGDFVYNSPSVKRVLGYDPKELAGQNAFGLISPRDLPRVRQAFEYGLHHPDETVTLEFRFRHRDGSWRFLEAVGQSRLGDAEMEGIVVNSRDVSDRKRAEAEVRESEKQYRLIFDGNPIPMWVFDQETLAFLQVNDAAIQHYGYSREEFLGMTVQDLGTGEEGPAMVEYLHKLLSAETPARMGLAGVWRHRKKDGSLIDVEIKWSPMLFHGRPASLTMANDITERRRVEHRDAALAKLGQSLSSATSPMEAARIIRSVADDLFTWDVFTLDLYSAEEQLVYSILNVDTDRTGQRFDIPTTSEGRKPSGMAQRVVTQGAELILRSEPLSMPDDVIPIGDVTRPSASLMLVPIRNRTKVIGILSIQSYTLKAYDTQHLNTLQTLADHCGGALERIHAERALRESELRFRELFQGSPDAIFVEDFAGTVLDVNPAGCQLHGTTRENLVGKGVCDLVPPESREAVRREFQLLAEGKVQQIEGASWTHDGRSVAVEVRANRINYAGQPAVLLHVRDMTDRKLAEAALRSSEMLFHSVWENSADGMLLTDEQGAIVAANQAFCTMVGLPREQLEGKPFTVVYTQTVPGEEMLEQYRRRFREQATENQVERRITLHNGKVLTFEESSSFVALRGHPSLLLGLYRDITEQRRLEEQLRQSQKMEAIGQLAGGVAHDFNNILTVIQGHASLLSASKALTEAGARSAQQIGQAAERAAALTRQLLAFGRRQMMQPRRLDMNEVVSNMTKMLGRLLGEDIALQLNYSPRPAFVHADAGMMEQVLLNLAVNSRDAMPKGGLLAIRISTAELTAGPGTAHPEGQSGRFVCLSVTDTGCGIPPENLRRIFEPFFTTKEVGKGTGLGLATVYGILKQHHGWIEVASEPGKGATFKVFLPRSAESAEAVAESSGEQVARGGKETILVVEDEAPVRELVCGLLTRYGYQVLPAESGRQALQIWRKSRHKIDLLLTDLVMPDRINGRELAEKLRAERPGLKVIFTSGYSADVVGKDFAGRSGQHYLQKPYHPHKLALAVRDCLDAVN
ncbi:MAG TPA: PAS domain S-box protein [Candidatus Acidoferrum sp.]|nr:PAS domain S-box protein [Candidatus Acidoferrum sp.]